MTVSPSSSARHEKLMRHAASARGDVAGEVNRKRRRPIFLVLLAACAFMLVVGVTLKHGRSRPEPASLVRERMTSMILNGAWLGGLFVQADGVDPTSGDLLHFRATADTVLLTAERAAIVFDADAATMSFDLTRVVLVGADDEVANGEGSMMSLDTHRLGPFPLTIRVQAEPVQPDATELLREFAEVPTDLPLR